MSKKFHTAVMPATEGLAFLKKSAEKELGIEIEPEHVVVVTAAELAKSYELNAKLKANEVPYVAPRPVRKFS